MPTTDTQIRGSLAVSRAATVGGSLTLRGTANIAGNVNIAGWLDAPNIKGPCKGLFPDLDSLTDAYPRPLPGWWALVGNALPARIYRSDHGTWADTCETGGDISVDLTAYDRRLDQLAEDLAAVQYSAPDTDHPVEVRDTDAADLIIADEQGNPIVTFADGHIRTAYFDSANIGAASAGTNPPAQSTSPWAGKKLSILGDSISTFSGTMPDGYAAYYPRSGLTDLRQTWWTQAAQTLGMTVLRNCSWSGSQVCGDSSSTSSASCGCSDRRIADLADGTTKPDLIIIWIGINDWGDSDRPVGDFSDKSELPTGTVSEFGAAYATAVIKAMRAYPGAQICCCTLLDVTEFYGTVPDKTYPRVSPRGQTIIDYNRKIAEICSITGATLIDLHSCGINFWNTSRYTIDGLHPNASGTYLIARKVVSTLLNT